jgi:hypothetical protein
VTGRGVGAPPGAPRTLQVDPATGIADCRIDGSPGLVEIVERVGAAIAECRRRGCDRLLIDLTGIHGVPIPTLHDRFLMVEEWAARAEGEIRIAVVTAEHYIDPRRFGVKVAADLGLVSEVFSDASAARAWLAAGRGQGGTGP